MIPRILSELPTALARLDCLSQRHAIRWEAGALVAFDHDDPEGERALVALGGAKTPCIEVLSAWSRQRDNADLRLALSRGTLDPVPVRIEGPQPIRAPGGMGPRNVLLARRGRRARGQWIAQVGTARGSAAAMRGAGGPPIADPGRSTFEDDVVLLAGLGPEMTLGLGSTVTAMLLDRVDAQDGSVVRPALEASLFGRALIARRTWLAVPDLDVDLTVAGRGDAPSLVWDGVGPAQLMLPARLGGEGLGVGVSPWWPGVSASASSMRRRVARLSPLWHRTSARSSDS